MKRIYVSLVCLAVSGLAFAQSPGKIKLVNGQKIVVESTADIEASLTIAGTMTSNSITVNALEVKNSDAKSYIISNTLTKLKMTSTSMMGQGGNYDSENKAGNDEQMAKIFDDKLNKPVDVTLDNTTGLAVAEKKKEKKSDDDETNPVADLMKIFSDNASDDAVVSGAFEIIPKGKSIGDSWADTTTGKDMKMIRIYTLKSIAGNEATIQSNFALTALNKLDFQGMEINIKSETKTNGEIVTDISTGLVKKRTSVADITGSIPMMGQDMPITAKVTSTTIYK
jgi:Family of unknown function (DUF6263)